MNVQTRIRPVLSCLIILEVASAFGIQEVHAATNAQSFTYQGRLLNTAGTAPLKDIVDIKFSIYDPAGSCLLYQENQTGVDLNATAGAFSTQVGSALDSSKRTGIDPALWMSQIFTNSTAAVRAPGTNCASGYTPAAGDARVLRVTVTPHSTGVATTITPDLMINSVPQAQTAETLQGFAPSDFIQSASSVAGQGNVSLSTLKSLTDASDAGSLHTHDSRYVKIGSAGANANLGTGAYTSGDNFGIGVSAPTGNLGFVGSGGAQIIEVERNSTANSAGNNLGLSAGGATTGSTNRSGGALVLSSGVSTGSAGSAITFQTSTAGSAGTSDNPVSTKMILTSAGKLGVNQTNPGAQLEVDSSSTSTVSAIIKGFTGQVADLFQAQDSTGITVAKIATDGSLTLAGPVTLPGNPSSAFQAATKQYVDSAITSSAGVASFNTRTGAVSLTSGDVTTSLTYTPLKNTTDTLTGNLTVTGASSAGGAAGANTQFQSTAATATNIGGVIKGAASQSADLFEFLDNTGAVLSKVDSAGMLTLASNPSSNLQAATKAYVDSVVSGSAANWAAPGTIGSTTPNSGAFTTLSSSGASSLNSLGVAGNTSVGGTLGATGATSLGSTLAVTGNTTVGGTLGVTGMITGNLSGNVTGAASQNVLKSGDTMTGALKMNTPVTADALAQILVATKADTNKGLVVQANSATQSANLAEFQSFTGAVLSKVDPTGKVFGKGLDAGSLKVTNVLDPASPQDAATKNYVDLAVTSGSANWPAPGTIGSTTPNTGAFTTLSSSGASTLSSLAVTNNASVGGTLGVTGMITGNLTGNVTGAASQNVLKAGDTMTGALKMSTPVTNDTLAQILVSTNADTNKGLVVQAHSATQSANLAEFQSSTGAVLSKVDQKGKLFCAGMDVSSQKITNVLDPTVAQDAATKNYVDTKVAGGVPTFNTRTGDVTLSSSDVTTALTYTPLKNTTDTLTGNLTVSAVGGFGGAAGANIQFQSTAIAATNIGAVIKGAPSQSADLLDFENSAGSVLSKVDSGGYLTLPGAPTTANMAATKGYVDSQVIGGVTSFNTRTGAVTLSSADVTSALTFTPLRNSSDTMSGTLGVGGAAGSNTQFRSIATSATTVGAVVQGAASQTADLIDILNSGGSTIAAFDSAGMLTLAGAPTSSMQAATKGYVDTAISGAGGNIMGTTGYIPQFSSATTIGSSPIFVSGGNIGIGTITPSQSFAVGNSNQFTVSSSGNLTAQSAMIGASSVSPIVVTGSGGPSSPNGVYAYGGQYNGANYYVNSAGGAIYYSSYWFIGPSLGQNSPGWYLSGSGSTPPLTSTWNDWSGGTGSVTTSAGSIGVTSIDGSGNITSAGYLKVNGTGNSYVLGNFGIGTTSPGYRLDVQGGGVNTSGAYTNVSDRRLKESIQSIPNESSLEQILRLRPVTYFWKDKNNDAGKQLGFIAQEVEEVIPELVKTNSNGFKSMNYAQLVSPIVGAIKELYAVSKGLLDRADKQERAIASIQNETTKAIASLAATAEKFETENIALKSQLKEGYNCALSNVDQVQIKELSAKNKALEERLDRLEKTLDAR